MREYQLFMIALGLAVDAFAVSITSGATIQRMRLRHALLIATFFGAFQGVMPLLGWLLAGEFGEAFRTAGHWVAFAVLVFVGSKMIYEARWTETHEDDRDPLNLYVLFILAVATSIDAFAVGVALAALDVSIVHPILVIGAVTFVLSLLGTYLGDMFGHLLEDRLEIVGGVLLILLGFKILIERLAAGT